MVIESLDQVTAVEDMYLHAYATDDVSAHYDWFKERKTSICIIHYIQDCTYNYFPLSTSVPISNSRSGSMEHQRSHADRRSLT